jgi:hypothetical protein
MAQESTPLVRFRISAHGVHVFLSGHWVKADREMFGDVKSLLYNMVKYNPKV